MREPEMPTYLYEATTFDGKTVSGCVRAAHGFEALLDLAQRDLSPFHLEELKGSNRRKRMAVHRLLRQLQKSLLHV